MEPRLFELQDINHLIPRLTSAFSRISVVKREVADLIDELRALGYEPTEGDLPSDLPEDSNTSKQAKRLYQLLDILRAEIEAIEETGGVLKNLDLGTVDFYGLREGKVICLCWQYGEPEIMYWHEVETGFRGRKPISEETKANRGRLN